MNTVRKNLIIGCLAAISAEALFGLSYVFIKGAMSIASPLALLGWRFIVAALVMSLLAFLGILKINLKGKSIKPILMVAVFNPVIYLIFEAVGIKYTTASESGAFLACIPVGALIASTIILKEKPHGKQVLGILITLAGVLITVFAVGATSSLYVSGYLALLAAVISYSLYTVFVDKASAFSGTEITYMMLICGAVMFSILSVGEAYINHSLYELITLPVKEPRFLIVVTYQAIFCSIIGFFLANISIEKIGVNRAASFLGVSTVVSILAGTIALKETFTLYQVIGSAIIIGGVYIANSFTNKD